MRWGLLVSQDCLNKGQEIVKNNGSLLSLSCGSQKSEIKVCCLNGTICFMFHFQILVVTGIPFHVEASLQYTTYHIIPMCLHIVVISVCICSNVIGAYSNDLDLNLQRLNFQIRLQSQWIRTSISSFNGQLIHNRNIGFNKIIQPITEQIRK